MAAVTNRPRRPAGLARPAGRRSGTFVSLFLLVLLLNLIGLVMVLSASSVTSLDDNGSSWFHFQRQAIWACLAFVALMVTMRVDYHRWRHLARPFLVVTVGLLLVVLLPGLGVSANGASRWIQLGPVTIQPSELAKLGIVVFAADLLARRAPSLHRSVAGLRPIVVVVAVLGGLILLQPSLGAAIIVGAIAFGVMFVAGVRFLPLAATALASMGLATALSMSASYRRDRVFAFLDPWDDPLNTGYQTIQSLVGIASGGLSGTGLGTGRAKFGYLPFAHTDFIFAVVAEELGWLGATFVIALFVGLAIVGIRISMQSRDLLGTLLAAGVTTWLTLQAFINIGAVVGLLPVTGVSLPFLSFGGSALVVNMAAIGIVLNVARQGRVQS